MAYSFDLQRVVKLVDWLIFNGDAKNRRELATKLGYTESSFSQIINGRVNLSDSFVKKLANLNKAVNTNWLLTGEGNMLKEGERGVTINGQGNRIINHGTDNSRYNSDNNSNDTEPLIKEIEHLNKLLNEKEKQLEEKERLISVLLK